MLSWDMEFHVLHMKEPRGGGKAALGFLWQTASNMALCLLVLLFLWDPFPLSIDWTYGLTSTMENMAEVMGCHFPE